MSLTALPYLSIWVQFILRALGAVKLQLFAEGWEMNILLGMRSAGKRRIAIDAGS
jgi:hypothetical protein